MRPRPLRIAIKIFGAEPGVPDSAFVPIFHEWIRDRALDTVLFDVADYSHVPNGPGIMLITHATAFALDRSDGGFGLRAQQRRPGDGDAAQAVADTVRQALVVVERLEADPRLRGRVAFERHSVRVESNDRLRAPNSDAGFEDLAPIIVAGLTSAFPDRVVRVARVPRPLRERLTVEATLTSDRMAMDMGMSMRDRPRAIT